MFWNMINTVKKHGVTKRQVFRAGWNGADIQIGNHGKNH